MSSCHTISRKTFLLPDDFLFSDRSACFSNEFYCPSFTPDCLGICGLKQLIHRRSRKNCVDFFTKVFWHDCRVYARWMQRESHSVWNQGRTRFSTLETLFFRGILAAKKEVKLENPQMARREGCWKTKRFRESNPCQKSPTSDILGEQSLSSSELKRSGKRGSSLTDRNPWNFCFRVCTLLWTLTKGKERRLFPISSLLENLRAKERFSQLLEQTFENWGKISLEEKILNFSLIWQMRVSKIPWIISTAKSRERSSAPFGTRFNLSTRTNSWDFSRSKLKEFSRI